MLARLLPDVASKRLPPLDRFNITNDLFALVEAGKASAVQFLQLLQASVNEDSLIVWQALDTGLSFRVVTIFRPRFFGQCSSAG